MKNIKKMDGTLIFIIASVFLTGIIAVKAHLSDKKKEIELNAKTEKIISLQEDLNESSKETNSKQSELIEEQRKNGILSEKILEFQEKLDQNATQLSELTKSIEDVTKSNNKISKLIANEQKSSGILNFKIKDVARYDLGIGGNLFSISKAELENGYNFINAPIISLPLAIKKNGDNIFLTTRLLNREGVLIIEIIDNEWFINKNTTFSINFDESGIEVIDKFGRLILQLSILENQFIINMIIYKQNSATFVTPQYTSSRLYDTESFNKLHIRHIIEENRLFKHGGENYIGKRRN